MKTEQEQIEELLTSLLAHQPLIDATYDQLNSIAIALIKIGYGYVHEYKAEIERLSNENCELTKRLGVRFTCDFVRTAPIDLLNKVKEKLDNAPNGWAYTTYIDELIEEIEK